MTEQSNRLVKFLDSIIKVKAIDIAAELGISRSTISRYLGGTLEPSTTFLRYLRTKYKLSYDWYFDGTGKPQLDKKEKLTMTVLTELNGALELVLKKQAIQERRINYIISELESKSRTQVGHN